VWETRTEMCKDSTGWCIVDGHCKKHLCMRRGKPFSKYFPMTATYHHSAARACRVAASICFVLLVFLAAVVSPVPAQTTRTWTNSTNTQFNNTANWKPTNAWADNDTLRFNGTVGGALDLYCQGGQNIGVTVDFTAAQTGAVSISLGNEAIDSRNFRMGHTNSSMAVSVSGSWTAAFPAGGFGRLEVARRDGCCRVAA